jgi:hypothetical protein
MIVADMAKGYSMSAFAGLIGVNRDTLHQWAKDHSDFSEAVSRGKAARLRDWEGVAIEMRRHGGGPGGATITMFGLKNMGGGEWDSAEKTDVKITADVKHTADDAFRDVILTLEIAGRAKARIAGDEGEVDSASPT